VILGIGCAVGCGLVWRGVRRPASPVGSAAAAGCNSDGREHEASDGERERAASG
jgi:hypothetical protein